MKGCHGLCPHVGAYKGAHSVKAFCKRRRLGCQVCFQIVDLYSRIMFQLFIKGCPVVVLGVKK